MMNTSAFKSGDRVRGLCNVATWNDPAGTIKWGELCGTVVRKSSGFTLVRFDGAPETSEVACYAADLLAEDASGPLPRAE